MAEEKHETKIVISGDAKGAVSAMTGVRGAIAKVQTALLGVRSAVSKLMMAFGVFVLALNAVNSLVGAFKWLKDKVTETSRELARIRWDAAMERAASATSRLVGLHERLSSLMKEELDTLAKKRALEDIEGRQAQDYEDGKRAADRARRIYEAKTPEEEQTLRDRFAAEDEQIARRRAKDERKARIAQLDSEESVYSGKAAGLRYNNDEIDRQIDAEQFNLRRAGNNVEYAEPIVKRLETLKKRKEANEAEIAQFEKEAKFRRDQIAALESQKAYDGPTAGYWQRKTDEKKREEAKAEKDRKEAEEKERRATKAANAFVSAYLDDQIADKRKLSSSAASFADRLTAVDSVSQNRLTAMGLGSGVSASGGMASDVKKLVHLLEKEIEATKANRPNATDTIATFTE